ncbi:MULTISPECIES: hypothetical protein [Spirosoma]|uniref:Uncharacterized protein n=1 Tax=Spirosoma liriopis TaxID=2937440 RepID=A0ABT0HGQ6_9BACT|nr:MULTISPECIES: hypothetical protein [Spirosoma]MCK8491325.1 hypothetical protein [Spirosoma liriopis]UHG90697.1 hypothetical protein LQ777_20935 [Spirosoma oryzicola]
MNVLFSLLMLTVVTTTSFGQLANSNSFEVQVDGKKYQTQPRRLRIGNYWWVTANSIKPDKSIRIWLGSYDNKDIIETGTYLIVDADRPDTRENKKKIQELGTYKGIAVVKFVEETREPRMEYHVGKSQNNDETITVKMGADGFLEATFNCSLAGSYWKEKATATVFGGVGRLINKMEDKAITKTTGYDSAIDPEGNGYSRQSKTDTITLTDGSFKLKMN